MEEIDRAIVGALTADGRLSYTDLAERVGLSVSAVHQRVRRLEQRGVISGYAARVSFEALDLPLTAFVAIRPFDPSQPDDAPERLAHLPEIDSCYSVAGEDFYLLLVRVAGPADLERLLQQIRTAANVTTRTTVVLSTPYENRPPRMPPAPQSPSSSPASPSSSPSSPVSSPVSSPGLSSPPSPLPLPSEGPDLAS